MDTPKKAGFREDAVNRGYAVLAAPVTDEKGGEHDPNHNSDQCI